MIKRLYVWRMTERNKMGIERIDRVELMHTFVRIIESGSLSAAAQQMNTTQATVSRRLKSLEDLLGARLLLRTTHAMKLTDDGERCYQHARIVVASPELLARHPPVEDIDSLAALPWVALSTFYRREVTLHHTRSGERQAFTVLPRLSSDSLYAIRRTILNGLGVGMISAWAVEEDLREGRLVQLLPQWQAPALPVYLLYPWARYYPARLRRFLELMKAVMPELAGMRQVTATKKQGKAGNKKAVIDRLFCAAKVTPPAEGALQGQRPDGWRCGRPQRLYR